LDLAVVFGRFVILGNFRYHINCSEGVYVNPVDLDQQCLVLISSICLVVQTLESLIAEVSLLLSLYMELVLVTIRKESAIASSKIVQTLDSFVIYVYLATLGIWSVCSLFSS
jgi:hypothetical protein